MERRSFDKAFKREAVRQVTEAGKSMSNAARKMGIHVNTLRRWADESMRHGESAFPGKGKLRPEDEEFRRLKRHITDLEEEKAILKKAAAIFARQPK